MRPMGFLELGVLVTCAVILACGESSDPAAPGGDQPPSVPDPPAEQGSWTTATSLPIPVGGFAAAAYRGMIYVGGGIVPGQDDARPFLRYDPSLDAWETLEDLPSASVRPHLAVASDTLFLIIGDTERIALLAYDPGSGSWSDRAPPPEHRDGAAVATAAGKIYLIGGEVVGGGFSFEEPDSVLVYHVSSGQWSRVAGSRTANARRRGAAVSVLNQLFVLSGLDLREPLTTAAIAVDALDVPSGEWNRAADMPVSRFEPAVALLEGRIHVLGGTTRPELDTDTPRDNHHVFDPVEGVWSEAPAIPTGRRGAGAVALNGRLYVFGGTDRQPNNVFTGTVVEVYTAN